MYIKAQGLAGNAARNLVINNDNRKAVNLCFSLLRFPDISARVLLHYLSRIYIYVSLISAPYLISNISEGYLPFHSV